MEFLIGICSTIIGEIAKVTVEPVGRQLGYLFYYQRNINDLRKQIEDLNLKKTSLDRQVEQARRRGEEIEEIVQKWQDEVEQCSKDAEDILKPEGHREAKCSYSRSFPNLVMRRKLSRKAKKMVEVIASKIEKVGTFESISYTPTVQSSFENNGFEGFSTRMLALKKIMEALKDLNFRRIGVHGSGGVGKTTLVKEAAQKSREEGLFTEVVMVTVSQSFDLQNIQKEIARMLGLKVPPDESKSVLADLLQHRLKREKKLLIILDDLWERLELEDAGIYFNKDGQEGCKILLVSRNRYVLRNDMGVEKDIMVELLSESEAMNLFKKVVGGKSEEPNFKDLVIAIVEKCGGLPVAIKPIARALKDRDISAWRTALRKLKSSPKDGYIEAYPCIKTSYDFLKDDEKMILLLCAQHREDENISVEDLMNIYAASCGLFLEVDTLQDARDLVRTLVDNLKGYNLLLEGEEDGSVKLHDVTREIMVSIAMEDKSMYCYENSRSLNRALVNGKLDHDAIGISLLGSDFNQFPDGLPCSKLKLLFMPSGVYWPLRRILFPKELMEKAIELRAFCIRSFIVETLPLSPCSLQNLQTLSLQHCVLEDMAFIGELKNLEVLDLSHSKFKQLPQQIGKLTCLRQLNLNQCTDLEEIQPKVISSLVRLEELYMDNVSVEWGVEVVDDERRNASLAEVKNLPQLSALHLCIEDAGVLPKDMFVDGKLRRFNIVVGGNKRDYELETSSRQLYLNLEKSCHLYEHGFPVLMKESEVLYLRTLSGVTCGLPFFKEKVAFSDRHPASSSMLNLTKLNVSSCMNLKHAFVYAFVGNLTQLKYLEIIDCPAMKEVIAVEEETNSHVILFPKLASLKLKGLGSLKKFCGGGYKIEFESLSELVIKNCPKLKTFTSNSMPTTSIRSAGEKIEQPLINDKAGYFNIMLSGITFRDLQELTIQNCNNLQYMLPFETVKSLKHLKKLKVCYCMGVEQIITKEEDGRLKDISFPKLESIDLNDLPRLKRFCEGDHVESPSLLALNIWKCPEFRTFISNSASVEETELVAQQSLFNNKVAFFNIMLSGITFRDLQELTIWKCHNLQYLLPFETVKSLKHLKKLDVFDCVGMEQIITKEEDGRLKNVSFPKLESIDLTALPKLKRFCEGDHVEIPSLLALNIWKCPEFGTFISNSASVEETELVAQQPLFNDKKIQTFTSNSIPSTSTSSVEEKIEQPLIKDKVTFFNIMLSEITFRVLQELTIWKCHNLKYLLPFETVKSLKHLKKLDVFDCVGMEQIITNEEDGRLKNVSFPKLESIDLTGLPKLKKFCEGDRVECHSLLKLKIWECPEFGTFIPNSTSVEGTELVAQQPLFNNKVVLTNLEELTVHDWWEDVIEIWSHQSSTVLFPNLKVLYLTQPHSSGFSLSKILRFKNLESIFLWGYLEEKIWQDEEHSQTLTYLRKLKLFELPKLMHLFEDPAAANIQFVISQIVRNLETLFIRKCDRLKTLVMSSSFSFENLTELQVSKCHGLVNLFDSSIAKTLVQLKTISIAECDQLIQVITEDVNKVEDELAESKLVFKQLKSLTLQLLPSLKSFYDGKDKLEFPKLEKLAVEKCPEMRTFSHGMSISSPNLKTIKTHYDTEEDLNNSMPSASTRSVGEKIEQPLINDEIRSFNTMLSEITFRDLQELAIWKCDNLQYLLPFETVKSLKHLKKFEVWYCMGVEQIITKAEDGRLKNISFPKLESIDLINLPKLKRFCEGNQVECPSLLKLKIRMCPEFKTFNDNSASVEETELVAQQLLFNDKVVLTDLEEMFVCDWWEDVNEIWPRQSSTILFPNLKVLYLTQPHSSGFSLSKILRFKNLESISLWGCFEEKIWQDEEHGQTLTYLRKLKLFELPNLMHLFEDPAAENIQFVISQIVRNLETLFIRKCDRLKTLVMSSSFSFENLTELQVIECHGLVNLFDLLRAKTLVQLKTMRIIECNQLIQVITEDVNKIEDELAEREIVFNQLESLTLELLPALKSFYAGKNKLEFPKLKKLAVKKCPEMRAFSHGMSISSPNLKTIDTGSDTEEDLKGDLNASIGKLWEKSRTTH